MIELNSKTQQDFLNREWVQKLLDAGVDMSDAKYYISYEDPDDIKGRDFICLKNELDIHPDSVKIANALDAFKKKGYINYEMDTLPTYTVSELLYKLHEYIYPTIDGKKYSGGLSFCKDAPFYMWYYELKHEEDKTLADVQYFYAEAEYPIESLAMLLMQCHEKDIGLKSKDTGNISDK